MWILDFKFTVFLKIFCLILFFLCVVRFLKLNFFVIGFIMNSEVFRVDGGWSCEFQKEIWLIGNEVIEGTFYIPGGDNGEWPERVDLSGTDVEKIVGFTNEIWLWNCKKIEGTFEIPRGNNGEWPEGVILCSSNVEKVVGFANRINLFGHKEIEGTFEIPRGNNGEWPKWVDLEYTNIEKVVTGYWSKCRIMRGGSTLVEYVGIIDFGYVGFRF
jgi:hypothetical protein